MESRTNLSPETKIVDVRALCLAKKVCASRYLGFSGIYGSMPKERPWQCSSAKIAWVAHPGVRHMYSFRPYGPSRVIPKLEARCFGEKLACYFYQQFYLSIVRFQSKSSSKLVGKVGTFDMYQKATRI
jgi:hypothetical protein